MTNNQDSKISRRSALKAAALGSAAVVAATTLTETEAVAAKCSTELLDEKEQAAKNIKYRANAAKVEKGLWTTKAGVPPEKQLCKHCILYQNAQSSCVEKAAPCSVASQKWVAAEGGCSVWNKKPGAKI